MSSAAECGWESRMEGKQNVWYTELDLSRVTFFDKPIEVQKDEVRKFIEDNVSFIEGRRCRH